MKHEQIVSQNPEIMSGTLVFAGTRVPVEIFIDYLKAGESIERFLEGFPTVSREQVDAFLEMSLETVKAEVDEAYSA